jgi:SAM-dependent methyltransferase
MSDSCPLPDFAPYLTGVLPDSGERLSHPGGFALSLRAMQLSGLIQGSRILDLGCGDGDTLRLLHSLGFDAAGVDSRPARSDQANRICAPADALPIRDQSIDGILAECSLSVMEDRDRVLKECVRVLAPGGRLIICDLYARNPAAISQVRALRRSCVAGMIVREELESELRLHGFALDRWEDHSQALREYVAHFLMAHDSLNGLWNRGGSGASAQEIQSAMKAARAGYFLLIAHLRSVKEEKK